MMISWWLWEKKTTLILFNFYWNQKINRITKSDDRKWTNSCTWFILHVPYLCHPTVEYGLIACGCCCCFSFCYFRLLRQSTAYTEMYTIALSGNIRKLYKNSSSHIHISISISININISMVLQRIRFQIFGIEMVRNTETKRKIEKAMVIHF